MDIKNIIARSQQLMTSSNFWNKVDNNSNALNYKSSGNKMSNEAMAYANSPTDYGMSYNYSYQQPQQVNIQENYEQSLNRLPEGLRESFSKQRPIEVKPHLSVLDSIPESYLQGLSGTNVDGLPSQSQMKQMINEKKIQPQQQPQMIGGGQVDYNYIKFMIQESIKEVLNSNENNLLKGIKLVNGSTFHFIDSKGNTYEAKLKKINK